MKVWDPNEFKTFNGHLPVEVDKLRYRWAFSARTDPPVRVLDMPIHMPEQGWRIPAILNQWIEMINRCMADFATIEPDPYRWYCYITVDQKPVGPGVSQRRPGAHSDSFLVDARGVQIDVVAENRDYFGQVVNAEIDITYIAYDCMPTLFYAGPWWLDAPDNCGLVLSSFDFQKKTMTPVTYPTYTALRLTPYCVHEALINATDEAIERTFVKLAFSRFRYNRQGNTHNDLFDYDWLMVPRDLAERGHRYV